MYLYRKLLLTPYINQPLSQVLSLPHWLSWTHGDDPTVSDIGSVQIGVGGMSMPHHVRLSWASWMSSYRFDYLYGSFPYQLNWEFAGGVWSDAARFLQIAARCSILCANVDINWRPSHCCWFDKFQPYLDRHLTFGDLCNPLLLVKWFLNHAPTPTFTDRSPYQICVDIFLSTLKCM